jgi:hypothetical protein
MNRIISILFLSCLSVLGGGTMSISVNSSATGYVLTNISGVPTITQSVSTASYTPSGDANVFAWFKADAIIGVTSGNAITTWPDSGPNGYTLSCYGGSQNPTWSSAVKNGLPAVVFASASSQETFTSSTFSSQAQPTTIFLVYKLTDSASGFEQVMGSYGSGTGYAIMDNSGPASVYAGSYQAGWSFDNNWHIVMVVFNGASSKYRLDGGADTSFSGTLGTDAINSVDLGKNNVSSGYYGGDIGEVVYYSGDQSANEVKIFGYLDGRWAAY